MELSKPKISILENTAVFLTTALAFLMITFFLPLTTEFFEFNKLALLSVVTLLLVLILGAKVVMGQPLNFLKSSIDFPLVLLLVAFLVSTVFSIDKTSSVWGAQGRWFPSLFAMLVVAFFYYLAAPNFSTARSIKMVLVGIIAGSTVSSLVSILSYFQVYVGSAPYFKISAFTLTGSTSTAILVAVIGAALSLYFAYKHESIPAKIAFITTTIVNFAYVAIMALNFGWVLLALAILLTIIAIDSKTIMADRFTTAILTTALLAIVLINVFPATRSFVKNDTIAAEVRLPVKESWVIAAASIQDYPLLATGPSTFHLNFSKYRPLNLNNSPMWNVRFDKPYNEIFNTLATMGVIGLAVFAFFYIKTIKLAFAAIKTQDDTTGLSNIIGVAIVIVLVSYLVTYATVLSTFMLFVLLAMLGAAQLLSEQKSTNGELVSLSLGSMAAVTTSIGETSAIKREYANLVATTPLVLAAFFGAYLFGRLYLGEYYMRKAIELASQNQAVQAYDFQGKAININPKRDTYHTAYAQTNLALANALAAKKDLNDQDKQTIQTLITQSIRSARISTEILNPSNVVNWETRAMIYRMLINIADNASDWAIGSYNSAINLEPTNPALRIDLGGVYFVKGDFLSAANLFRQATALKNDYANAHYNFAQSLLNLKDFEGAKRELQATQALVAPDSPDFKLVQDQINALEQQLSSVAGASTTANNKPTVEQLANDNQTPPVNQGPLSTPSTNNTENLNPAVLPSTSPTPTPSATVTPTPSPKPTENK
jgi:O-antigen ligase